MISQRIGNRSQRLRRANTHNQGMRTQYEADLEALLGTPAENEAKLAASLAALAAYDATLSQRLEDLTRAGDLCIAEHSAPRTDGTPKGPGV